MVRGPYIIVACGYPQQHEVIQLFGEKNINGSAWCGFIVCFCGKNFVSWPNNDRSFIFLGQSWCDSSLALYVN